MAITDRLTSKLGPLPVWAWAFVVVGGVGAFVLVRNQFGGSDASGGVVLDTTPVDTTPNVPPASDTGPAEFIPTIGNYGVTTNQQWRALVSKGLLNSGKPASKVSHMLTVYLAGDGAPLPADEFDLWEQAITAYGEPPDAPPPPTKQTVNSPSSGSWKMVVQRHQTSAPEGGLQLVKRFSAPDAPDTELRKALTLTVNNPANLKYRPYFSGHGGTFPSGDLRVTTVQKG